MQLNFNLPPTEPLLDEPLALRRYRAPSPQNRDGLLLLTRPSPHIKRAIFRTRDVDFP